MTNSITYLSCDNDDLELVNYSKKILSDFFKTESYNLNTEEGQILFIASGGSEQNADRLTKKHQNITLLCHRENNSFAAAIEIAAFLRAQNKRATIIDVFAPSAFQEFTELQKVNRALETLSQQKAALIGKVSDWLIASDASPELIKERLNIELIHLPWSRLPDYRKKESSAEFLEYFPGVNPEKLQQTAKVYSLLQDVIEEYQLSAISIECFSMVVCDRVTACLPLAVLNKKNKVAACEGDICSMLGKMLVRAVANEIPWQANIAEIKTESILFAHCTAPLNMLKSFDVTTHFETNCGTAIKGKFKKQKVGVFRLNSQLDKYTLLEGAIIDTPDYDFACRTQIEVNVGTQQANLLKNKSLGNHQLIFPAKHIVFMKRLMQVLEINRVE